MSVSINTSVVVYCQISGFPRYKIGTDGTLLKLGLPRHRAFARPIIDTVWRPATTHQTKDGYIFTRMFSGSMQAGHADKYIHPLVLECFVGPCPAGMECRHLDGCKTNNSLSNLCWGTYSDNESDKILHGLSIDTTRKLDESKVLAIRTKYLCGRSVSSLAEEYMVSAFTIRNVVNYRSWKHVEISFISMYNGKTNEASGQSIDKLTDLGSRSVVRRDVNEALRKSLDKLTNLG